jgi:hypothetical protein
VGTSSAQGALTHEAKGDTGTPMLLARSRHASVRSLERYARPGRRPSPATLPSPTRRPPAARTLSVVFAGNYSDRVRQNPRSLLLNGCAVEHSGPWTMGVLGHGRARGGEQVTSRRSRSR